MFAKVGKGGKKAGFRVMLKSFEINKSFTCSNLFCYHIKQVDSMLPCACSVIDHRRRQNVARTSVTQSAITLHAAFLFLPHFDVICDLLLNRCTVTWNFECNNVNFEVTWKILKQAAPYNPASNGSNLYLREKYFIYYL